MKNLCSTCCPATSNIQTVEVNESNCYYVMSWKINIFYLSWYSHFLEYSEYVPKNTPLIILTHFVLYLLKIRTKTIPQATDITKR